jgi:uncharacterized protein YwgA
MSTNQLNRIAAITRLLGLSGRKLGRTAVMKLCFFLQSIKDVPLGYEFTLYSYGPFDSDVLADLQTAENLGVISSDIEYYVGGYGYEISPTARAKEVEAVSDDFLGKYSSEIEWVANTFSSLSATDLELLSTIVFISQKRVILSDTALIAQVHQVKPHFSTDRIAEKIAWLKKINVMK